MSAIDFTPAPAAAVGWRRVLAHGLTESRLLVRNGEQLLLALVIPIAILVGGRFLGHRRFDRLFAHDAHGCDDRVRVGENLYVLVLRNIRNVQQVVNAQIRDIQVNRVRDVSRVATNLDLAQHLLKNAALLAHTDWLANQVNRNGEFHLLAAHEAS